MSSVTCCNVHQSLIFVSMSEDEEDDDQTGCEIVSNEADNLPPCTLLK
jgi:hypothetical protein